VKKTAFFTENGIQKTQIRGGYEMKKIMVLLSVGLLIGCATIWGTDITKSEEYIEYTKEVRNVCSKISMDSYTSERELDDDIAVVNSRLSLITAKNPSRVSRASLEKFKTLGFKYLEWTNDHSQLLRDRSYAQKSPENVTDRQMEAIELQYGRHIGEKWPY
jgi:hypothetical protein